MMPSHRGSPSLSCSSLALRACMPLWLEANLVLGPGHPMSPGHMVQQGMWLNATPLATEPALLAWLHPHGECCTSTLHSAWGRLCTGVHPALSPGHPPGCRAGWREPWLACAALVWWYTHWGAVPWPQGPGCDLQGLWERSAGHPHRLREAGGVRTPVRALRPCVCTVYTPRGVYIYTHVRTRKRGLRRASCCDAKSPGPADE